jgi:sugar phosphate isomerase/epimerase
MEPGLTAGDSIDRAESPAAGFDFVEFGPAEAADVPESLDDERIRTTLRDPDLAFDVHPPFEQVVSTPVPEINDAIVAHQRRLLDWAGDLGARTAVSHGTVRDPHDLDRRSRSPRSSRASSPRVASGAWRSSSGTSTTGRRASSSPCSATSPRWPTSPSASTSDTRTSRTATSASSGS